MNSREKLDNGIDLPHAHIIVKGGIYDCHYSFLRIGTRISCVRRTCHHHERRVSIAPFFRFLPPVKSYHRALGAIHKLGYFSIDDDKKIEHTRTEKETQYTSLTKLDIGFSDLVKILMKQNHSFAENDNFKQCDEIRLLRTSAKINIDPNKALVWLLQMFGNPPEEPQELQQLPQPIEWVLTLKNGRELDKIVYASGRSPLGEFYEAAEDWLRTKLSYYVVTMIGAWLVLALLLIVYANLR